MKIDMDELKKCSKCRNLKDKKDFYYSSGSSDGLKSWCKECCKEYRDNNRTILNKKKKEHYYNNILSIKAQKKKYRINNIEILNEKSKKYYYNNLDTIKKTNKEYLFSKVLFTSAYIEQIRLYEEINESIDGYLLVKCAYCGTFFTPTMGEVARRLRSINNVLRGESRLYCSEGCKKACPIFGQMKYPKGFKKSTAREVQPQLRKLVFERDGWACLKCGKSVGEVELHCHHIEGLNQNPIESADVDNCLTLCKEHHKEVHEQRGCFYHDLKCGIK